MVLLVICLAVGLLVALGALLQTAKTCVEEWLVTALMVVVALIYAGVILGQHTGM